MLLSTRIRAWARPVVTSQIRTSPSAPLEASQLPSGATATAITILIGMALAEPRITQLRRIMRRALAGPEAGERCRPGSRLSVRVPSGFLAAEEVTSGLAAPLVIRADRA